MQIYISNVLLEASYKSYYRCKIFMKRLQEKLKFSRLPQHNKYTIADLQNKSY